MKAGRALIAMLCVCCGLLLGGCAGMRDGMPSSAGQKLDPWENWNRKVFGFNESLDEKVLKPVATGYRDVVPEVMRMGVSNVFNNVSDGWSAINAFLQGKLEAGLHNTLRFAFNSTFGFAGLLDVAGAMGVESQSEDFGQTLGRWGVGAGAYVVWPVIGPSTVRESFAMPLDRLATPAVVFGDLGPQLGITALQITNTRADLLGASRILDDIALDKYSFVRDAYLARRRSLVFDGDPPERPPSSDADLPDEPQQSKAPGQ